MNIYTLGYEKKNIDEYINILLENEIKVVIDVRETPWSHKKHFCKKSFSDSLENNGIEYIHVQKLGNPKSLRSLDLKPEEILKKYKSYLKQTESGIEQFNELLNDAKNKKINICLTCFEREHTSCHRSVILDHISPLKHAKVIHLA